jgi:hypothetical protein
VPKPRARAAGEFHQGKADRPVDARDRDPQPVLAPPRLERGETGGRHGDDAAEADARVAQVSFVFDLRQQLDFVAAGTANHGKGLVTLPGSLEEVP